MAAFDLQLTLNTDEEDASCVYIAKDGTILTGHDGALKCWSPQGALVARVTPLQGPVTCVHQSPTCSDTFAYSAGAAIICCDRRKWSTPVRVLSAEDEVNEVRFNQNGKYLCAGDDSGEVTVVDTERGTVLQRLNGGHDNICCTVAFNPGRPWEVVSGGLDCKLLRWNFSIGRLLGATVACDEAGDGAARITAVNPPFVYGIDVLPLVDSCVAACGLGNGHTALYSLKGNRGPCQLSAVRLHSSAVVRLCHMTTPALKTLLVTGGNDGNLMVSEVQGGEKRSSITLVGSAKHGSKINWVTANDGEPTYLVGVADQTQYVKVYGVN